ncbi:MAG: insulinase family protein [Deltaproteobacteria bacterium]|nr:insulinase family protein [Deltaproteobacteria bacterium]
MLQVVQRTLSNGLRVLVLKLPHVHAVSHALFVRGGSRFEDEESSGISHMVEHLLFRGTVPHPDSLSFNVAIEAVGGEINGLTQRDAVTIHVTVPPASALEGLSLLGEVITQPRLTGLEIERHVVMEEILDTLDQDGNELDADTLARKTLWPNHPIALPIAGTPETVERLTEAACRAHYERLFVAQNAVLCVAGPVDADAIVATAEESFGRMPRGERLEAASAPIPAVWAPIQVQPTDDSQVSLLFSFPAPHENDPDFATLLLLKRLLDDGFGARLRQAICEQTGLAYSLGACVDAYADVAALDIELSCAPAKAVRATQKVLETLRALAHEPVGEAELTRAKTRHRAEVEFALDDPGEMCGWYGAMVLVDSDIDYETRLEQVLRVTAADVQRLATQLFANPSCLLTILGPVEEAHVQAMEACLGRAPGSSQWAASSSDEDDGEDESGDEEERELSDATEADEQTDETDETENEDSADDSPLRIEEEEVWPPLALVASS